MNKRVRRVFNTLRRKGLTRAYLNIDGTEYIYPGMMEQKRPVKNVYIAALVSVIVIFAGIQIYNRLLKPTQPSPAAGMEHLETTDRYGMTPLHHAVIRADMNEIKGLVTGGATVNARDGYGWTPLHWAVFKKNAAICRFLLENGSNPTIKTQKKWFKYPAGLTAIEMAEILNIPEILK